MSIVTAPSPRTSPGTPRTARPPSGRRGRAVAQVVAPLVVFALVIGLWLFISFVLLEPRRRFLMPPPLEVVQVGFLDSRNLSEILGGLWATTQVAVVGLAVAIAIGTIVPVAMIQARWVEWSIYPWAVVLQTIPILAIVPLIGFWFQFGFSSRVLVCVLISLFPIITNTLFGLKSSDQ
ncbi:MAG TPA: ABC transporter permease, partial [Chloroflexota bacterium]